MSTDLRQKEKAVAAIVQGTFHGELLASFKSHGYSPNSFAFFSTAE